MPSSDPSLDIECSALCRQIFDASPSAAQLVQYRLANAQAFGPADEADLAWVREAVAKARDLEALELVLRVSHPDNVLSKKIQILSFLVEATPAGFPHFVRTHDARLQAWASLALSAFRSLYKFVKGQGLLLFSAPPGRRRA